MSARNDGGPAFPREDYQTDSANGQSGMSLRDYFAARALHGLLSDSDTLIGIGQDAKARKIDTDEYAARCAYEYADAMLRAREATP